MEDIQVLDSISESEKVNCLKSLLDHWKLVQWIKKFQSNEGCLKLLILLYFVSIGVKGLRTFAQVALDTTDDDMTITLLSDLCTVGNSVGKLLFHLPEPCRLNDLVTICDVLWEDSFHSKMVNDYINLLPLVQFC